MSQRKMLFNQVEPKASPIIVPNWNVGNYGVANFQEARRLLLFKGSKRVYAVSSFEGLGWMLSKIFILMLVDIHHTFSKTCTGETCGVSCWHTWAGQSGWERYVRMLRRLHPLLRKPRWFKHLLYGELVLQLILKLSSLTNNSARQCSVWRRRLRAVIVCCLSHCSIRLETNTLYEWLLMFPMTPGHPRGTQEEESQN